MPRRRAVRTLMPVLAVAACAAAGVAALSVAGRDRAGAPAASVATRVTDPTPVPAAPARAGEGRLVAALDALDLRMPSTSCLVVADGAEVVLARREHLPLLPASATKLLTAAAFLAATGAGDDDRIASALRDSDNGAAAALLAEAGGPDEARRTLAAEGYDVAGVVLVDGTGLDRRNRATCAVLHEVLARSAAGGPVAEGLAVAGRSGTLRDRFAGTPAEGRVIAKTGSIRGAAALAGHVRALDGTTLTFVQLLGDVDADTATALQDELVAVLLTGYGAQGPAGA